MTAGKPAKGKHGGLRNPPGGRPRIFSKPLAETILQVIRAGLYIEAAADYAGILPTTIYAWLREGDRYYEDATHRFDELRAQAATAEAMNRTLPKRKKVAVPAVPPEPWLVLENPLHRDLAWFSQAWRKAGKEAEMRYALRIDEASKKDGRLALLWLVHRYPERYSRRRLEISGPGGGPVRTEGKVSLYLPANGREAPGLEPFDDDEGDDG